MTLPVDPSTPSGIRIPANLRDDLKKIHIVGRPGMGRGCSSVHERWILEELWQGHPIVVLDPRGELIEVTLIGPPARTEPKGEPCPGSRPSTATPAIRRQKDTSSRTPCDLPQDATCERDDEEKRP
jgi:hypothetical protein